jgi:uncharacterized SAM-binding protein YcdF (DUF218 family)
MVFSTTMSSLFRSEHPDRREMVRGRHWSWLRNAQEDVTVWLTPIGTVIRAWLPGEVPDGARMRGHRASRLLFSFLCIGALVAGAASVDPVRAALFEWLREVLERRFVPANAYGDMSVAGIVVLGGQKARISSAVELADTIRTDVKIILSGAGDDEIALLREYGINWKQAFFEVDARNTLENAIYSLKIAKPKPGETWLLVTSAAHMPRAIGTFIGQGFNVQPWPVDYQKSGDTASVVGHELLGLLYYRLMGFTPMLFPGPDLLQGARPIRSAQPLRR